ncbi:MAG: AraC family transcriptional regulator [Chloroflexi bacterium]|nr:MAG: AraC family transcriptional regulator [Chloroflexota bacterium]
MGKLIKIESISQIHQMIGYAKPKHPLITFIESPKIPRSNKPVIDQPVISSLYSISLKNGHECKINYGRQPYDFQEGSLMFIAPGQIITPISESKNTDTAGWSLLFHPDLIRKGSLANKMKAYTFFSYDSHEALHVSEQERKTVSSIVKTIKKEYSQNLDIYSHELIISNLELLLNYCKRYYGRQFITRTNVNKDLIIKVEDFLQSYFDSHQLENQGLPNVKQCAEAMGYSPNYLSDLLKKETGKNTQEHIHFYLIEKAKTMLLGSEEPVYKIAQALGFEYQQHFSKLFKNKTGMSPVEYRN